ncbi:hypothetical protein M8997_021855 [Phyllobacterium sp. 21LDTY02-6]|jgi:hypothetical protein|uniref:hypothetical protein n=1 Tax=Phyllobacterium sp. 21LDTY02-6 TaxID=2944903 RepID=UPI0020203C37|nr:hypothetical protein [Phyllobacterium sp. 21LDTY02-6]MCO4319838.1 hypothetical protein [Phyllobacterium sp. 21LDTY02-6]
MDLIRLVAAGLPALFIAACTTTGASGGLTDDARSLVTTSYRCQEALGREPHFSAIESSETVLRHLGSSPEQADGTVRGWLRELIASSHKPNDLDAATCRDTLLKQAEKLRIGNERLRRRPA